MPLSLKTVPANRGPRWVGDAFRLFARRPLAFTALFALFLLAAFVLSLLPFLGGLLQMMMVPLLSLGFMVAGQSALLGGPVKPGQFIEPLQGDPQRRRALLTLCVVYGVSAVAILLLCDLVSNDALERLQVLLAQGPAAQKEVDALLSEPGVATAMLLGVGLGIALTIPFWHAPALVHWGGQGAGQALFSSALAVWRSKGAFVLYFVTWFGLAAGFAITASLVLGLLGLGGVANAVALPVGLLVSTVYYVSVLFTFNDSFGNAAPPDNATEPA
jgi:hypothetical protein